MPDKAGFRQLQHDIYPHRALYCYRDPCVCWPFITVPTFSCDRLISCFLELSTVRFCDFVSPFLLFFSYSMFLNTCIPYIHLSTICIFLRRTRRKWPFWNWSLFLPSAMDVLQAFIYIHVILCERSLTTNSTFCLDLFSTVLKIK